MSTQTYIDRKLTSFSLADCGHTVTVWSREYADGSYEFHGEAACDTCRAVLKASFVAAVPGVPITDADGDGGDAA